MAVLSEAVSQALGLGLCTFHCRRRMMWLAAAAVLLAKLPQAQMIRGLLSWQLCMRI